MCSAETIQQYQYISIYEFHSEVAVIILTSKIQGVFLFYIFEYYAFQKFGLLSTLHMLGPFIFTFTFTLESEEFEKFEKVAAAGYVIDHDQH